MNIIQKIANFKSHNKLGVLICCADKVRPSYSYYQLIRKKQFIDVHYSVEELEKLDDLPSDSNHTPTILCIQGSGLLQRIICESFEDISQKIPNINTNDYLIDIEELDSERKLVALCRKELIEQIFVFVKPTSFPILGIHLGFIGLTHYLSMFEPANSIFEFGGHTVIIRENRVETINKSAAQPISTKYFAEKSRQPSEIVALIAALEFISQNKWKTFSLNHIEENLDEYSSSVVNNLLIRYLVPILLLVLAINFFLFEHFSNKENELMIFSSEATTAQEQILKLQNNIGRYKKIINQNEIQSNTSFAFYTDRIAACLDAENIQLTSLSICPQSSKLKPDKPIQIKNKTIWIKGIANSSLAFSSFIEQIKKKNWVSQINKQVYLYNKEKETADFEIELVVNGTDD